MSNKKSVVIPIWESEEFLKGELWMLEHLLKIAKDPVLVALLSEIRFIVDLKVKALNGSEAETSA